MPDASVSCPGCGLRTLAAVDLEKPRTARVEQLLLRNDPPRDSELADFHLVVQQTPQILADITGMISQATDILERLVKARTQTLSHLQDAKSLIHPIRRLPSEILGEIFQHCVPTWALRPPKDSQYDSLDPRYSPWTLSHVCHLWRDIVTTSPYLWSHLSLHASLHKKVPGRRLLYQLGLYIERSMPRDLTVVLRGDKHGIHDSPMLPILELSTARWSKLYAVLPTTSLQSFSGNGFPRLQELSVKCIEGSEQDVTVTTFATLPNIQRFEGFRRKASFELVQIPWNRLKKYVCDTYPIQSIATLNKMSRLRSLHVGLSKKAVIETPLHLPTLTELSLEETGRAGRLEEFSKHLHIPAVVELVLAFDSPYHPVLYFPSFATPPVSLTKLTLPCAMTDHVENTSRLLYFLRSLAHLEDVTLDDLGVTTDFLDGLCVTYHVPILPCLQRLDIGNCELSDDEGREKLLLMLESRSPIVGNEFGPNKKLERLHAARWMEQIDLDRWTTICTALKVVTYEPDD